MNNTVNYDALKYIQGQTKTIRKTNNTFCCLFVKKNDRKNNVSYKNTNGQLNTKRNPDGTVVQSRITITMSNTSLPSYPPMATIIRGINFL